jgi:hypothetical protein
LSYRRFVFVYLVFFAAGTGILHALGQSQPANATGDEIKRRIAIFERDPERFKPEPVVPTPPGSPIGDDEII